MMSVNKITVSSVKFYDTSTVHYIVCLPPKVKSSSLTMYLTPFTLYYSPTPFPLVTTILLSVSVSFCYFCVFICCFQFYIPHMSEIIWFWAFSVWLISLSMIFSRAIHVVTNGSISSFLIWLSSIPLSMYVPYILYPVICKGLQVFPCLGQWIMLQWT